jgi:hypothetical protein
MTRDMTADWRNWNREILQSGQIDYGSFGGLKNEENLLDWVELSRG